MLSFNFRNFCEAYYEMIWKMKVMGVSNDTRNGPVLSIPEPIGITIKNPEQRVIFDEVRDANPFFHLLEAVWMLAGEQNVEWLSNFNKRMEGFAESDGILRGAYGFRWRYHFGYDQILWATTELKRDPRSRRVVISMWDQTHDTIGATKEVRDIPCNTHLYFRIENDKLEMTACNRSNDMIWGMLGANAVHMTILQEVMARELELGVGQYTVMTNNLHIYKNLPKFKDIMETIGVVDPYSFHVKPTAINFDNLPNFLEECRSAIYGHWQYVHNNWLNRVVRPVHNAWFDRTDERVNEIMADDWRLACQEWINRRKSTSVQT